MKTVLRFATQIDRRILLTMTTILWIGAFFAFRLDYHSDDFYVLWLGGTYILKGQSPYSDAAYQMLQATWFSDWAIAGNAYPLPALLLVTPLSLLPLSIAGVIWMIFGLVMIGLLPMIHKNWQAHIILLMLFMPLHYAVKLQQATLIWVGFAIVLIIALQRKWWILAGFCMAILPAKPQTGLIFAIAAGIWALQHYRPLIGWASLWSVVIWGGSFLVQPNWVVEWWAALKLYQGYVVFISILPLALVMLVSSYRLPWYAIAAVLQVICFPVNHLYSTLPLLIAWMSISHPLAWLGAGISWLWMISDLPYTSTTLWITIFFPYVLICAWVILKKPAFAERYSLPFFKPQPPSAETPAQSV